MFGTHFYHQRIRRSVATFGALFNNLYILRKGSDGSVVKTERVPLAYAPRRKYLERIRENPDLDEDTSTAIRLPRMSFEITDFSYDPTRQVAKTNKLVATSGEQIRRMVYTGVPYTINFQLNIYAKGHDDALQVVEQIMPYFTPQYTLTIKPFDDYPSITEDVPLTITNSSFTDDFEAELGARRTIIYTLDFEMKVLFYGPIGEQGIIRTVITNYYLEGDDSDTHVSRIVITPDPIDVSPDSDYGFTTVKYDYVDSGR